MHPPTLAAPATRATPSRRAALEWADAGKLLVVIGLMTVGVIVMEPRLFMRVKCTGGQQTNCANNLRSIHLAMMCYKSDNDDLWPVRPTGIDGLPITDPAMRRFVGLDGSATIAASFEYLAASMGGELTPKLFACPTNVTTRFATNADLALGYASGTSAWATAGPAQLAYAYDPGAPKDARATRVVLGERPLTATSANHKGILNVIYADGRVGTVRLGSRTTPSTTLAQNGEAISASAIADKTDDIFRPDHADPGGIGDGPATWAFLR